MIVKLNLAARRVPFEYHNGPVVLHLCSPLPERCLQTSVLAPGGLAYDDSIKPQRDMASG